MDNLIKIEEISSYPKELIDFWEEDKECLYNTFSNGEVSLDSSTYLYRQVYEIIRNKFFYAFHGSRIIDATSIIENGILLSSSSDFLLEHLIENIKSSVTNEELKMIKDTLYKISRVNDINKKYNKIWFILGKKEDVSIENGFFMLKKYGGELLEDAFAELGKDRTYRQKIASIGIPHVIEFKVKFSEINNSKRDLIIKRMLEKYLFDTKSKYEFIEAHTESNIPREQIISAIPINIEEN